MDSAEYYTHLFHFKMQSSCLLYVLHKLRRNERSENLHDHPYLYAMPPGTESFRRLFLLAFMDPRYYPTRTNIIVDQSWLRLVYLSPKSCIPQLSMNPFMACARVPYASWRAFFNKSLYTFSIRKHFSIPASE